MLGGWVNPHRGQQTILQGQTSIPPKSFSTPTANGQIAPCSGSARGVGRGAGSHTPSTAPESMKRDRRKSLSCIQTAWYINIDMAARPGGICRGAIALVGSRRLLSAADE